MKSEPKSRKLKVTKCLEDRELKKAKKGKNCFKITDQTKEKGRDNIQGYSLFTRSTKPKV
jgi:hypothetical protein